MRHRLCGRYPADAVCKTENCGKRPMAKQLCNACYSRLRRNGDTTLRVLRDPYQTWPDLELSLAAGLMEGEGSVRLNAVTKRNRGALIVAMSNTNKQIIDWMNHRWPGHTRALIRPSPRHKQAWLWCIASNKALEFLLAIQPYVITTRMKSRIETAIHWQEIKKKLWQQRTESDFEDAFNTWHWMAELNARGFQA